MRAREYRKGEVTAFLALIFLLLVSFTGSMMESASLQSAKSSRRGDMNRAMESVFAEYQRELLEKFDIFALEGTYETGSYREENLTDRLSFYGASGIDQEVRRIRLLTDDQGAPFRDQVARYVESKYGFGSLNRLLNDVSSWKGEEDGAGEYEQLKTELDQKLSGILAENQQELPAEGNPLSNIRRLSSAPLAELVMGSGQTVSEKQLDLSDAVSGRTLRKGRGDFSDTLEEKSLSAIGFGVYVTDHFSTAVPEEQGSDGGEAAAGGTLEYEAEYILAGKASDRENLETVLRRILLLRFVPNYAYLKGNSAKQAEAQGMALSLCAAIALPAAAEALAEALLFAWAFGESVMDLRSLMKGGGVPLAKTDESWQLSLAALMTLGTEEDCPDGAETPGGITYRQYLQALLAAGYEPGASLRALDLIELYLRREKGMSWFRADQCISKIETESTVRLRRGVTYRFRTCYGYQ